MTDEKKTLVAVEVVAIRKSSESSEVLAKQYDVSIGTIEKARAHGI